MDEDKQVQRVWNTQNCVSIFLSDRRLETQRTPFLWRLCSCVHTWLSEVWMGIERWFSYSNIDICQRVGCVVCKRKVKENRNCVMCVSADCLTRFYFLCADLVLQVTIDISRTKAIYLLFSFFHFKREFSYECTLIYSNSSTFIDSTNTLWKSLLPPVSQLASTHSDASRCGDGALVYQQTSYARLKFNVQ